MWWLAGLAAFALVAGLGFLAYDWAGNHGPAGPPDPNYPSREPERTFRTIGLALLVLAVIFGASAGCAAVP